MKRMLLMTVCSIFLTVLLSACAQGGTDLPLRPLRIPDKLAFHGWPVKAACYIDTSQYNPLNALDYAIDGVQFFDFVILGDAQIRQHAGSAHLYIPEHLRAVIRQRSAIIDPLKRSGIRLILGLTGGGQNFSFSTMEEDDLEVNFPAEVYEFLDFYGIEGILYHDINTGSIYPPAFLYEDTDEIETWRKGGSYVNDGMFFIGLTFSPQDRRTLFLVEENYGAWLPTDVEGSSKFATFTGTAAYCNWFVNPRTDHFPDRSVTFETSEADFISAMQYAPFTIDLGGSQPAPPITDSTGNDKDILSFVTQFYEGYFSLLFYRNLRPVSQAGFNQADYMSIGTQVIFGKDVSVTAGGGDHLKT